MDPVSHHSRVLAGPGPDGDYPGGDRTINLVGGGGFYAIYDDANGFEELDRDLTRLQAIEEWRSRLTTDLVPFDGWFEEAFKDKAEIALKHSYVFWDDDSDIVIIDKIPIIFRVDYPIIPGPAAKSRK